MNRLLFGLAAALALLASEAVADGMPKSTAGPPAQCCAAAPSWNGFYLGAGIGAGAVVHDIDVNAAGTSVLGFDGIGGEGIFGTVIAGFDRQIAPHIVAGAFFDYDFSNISTDLNVGAGLLSGSLDHKHSWSVGGRVGYLTSPATLWYGLAGYTQATFDLSSNIGSLDLPEFNGYFVGGGVESILRDGWSLRAEYRFTQFDSESLFSVPGVIDVNMEPSMHTARLALTYRFNRREEYAPLK
jgi:outer membrane immunogenic protein